MPSYNGAKKLPNILQALSEQNHQDFELIIVLDGSNDNSLEVIEKMNLKFKDFKILERQNGGRAMARNTGAKEAKGDLLIFFDDDMRPTNQVIALHQKRHQEQKDIILVGNPIEDYKAVQNDIQKYKAQLSRKWASPFEGKANIKLNDKNVFLTAANFSIPAKLFWQLNGFDERLTDAEDFDLAVRATQKQIPIYFDTSIIAWHDDFISLKSYINRQKQYKKSHETLKKLKPELYAEFNQYEYKQIGFFKKIIYKFFSLSCWVWSVDNFNWLKIFPKKIRYKLYDIIITGKSVYFPSK